VSVADSVSGISRAAGVANWAAGVHLFTYGLFLNFTASKTFDRPFFFRVAALLVTTGALVAAGGWLIRVRRFGAVFAVFYVTALSILMAEVYASKGALAVAQLVGLAAVLILTAVAVYRLSTPFELLPQPRAAGGLKVGREAAEEHMRALPARAPGADRDA
jgi:hypothetical protein